MEKILAITIGDFSEKIHFLSCLPEIELQMVLKHVKIIHKMMVTNQIQDYISKNSEIRMINSSINSHLKARITLIGEVILIILYESHLESNHIVNINNRLIESLVILTRTKKIKLDMLLKKNHEVSTLLSDTVFYLDPRMRLNPKIEIFSSNQVVNVNSLII